MKNLKVLLIAIIYVTHIMADTVLQHNTVVAAWIDSDGDQDHYSFEAKAGETIWLSMADVNDTALYPELSIYAPSGAEVKSSINMDAVHFKDVQLNETGTYSVIAKDNGSHTGLYNLRFIKIQDINETTATPLINDLNPAQMMVWGDFDTYAFEGEVNDTVWMSLAPTDGSVRPELFLYAPSGEKITSKWSPSESTRFEVRLSESGTHRVVATDYDGNGEGVYNLYFVKLPGANEYGALLTDDTPVLETIETGDFDTYQFCARANQNISISMVELNDTSLKPALHLYAPSGEKLIARYSDGGAYIDNVQLSETGIYSVVATDYDGYRTGEYRLEIENSATCAFDMSALYLLLC